MAIKRLTKEQIEGEYLKAESALRDALAFLDVALQRITRLYPDNQHHPNRAAIRTIHEETASLVRDLSHEYGTRYGHHVEDLLKMSRHELPTPVDEKVTTTT